MWIFTADSQIIKKKCESEVKILEEKKRLVLKYIQDLVFVKKMLIKKLNKRLI